MAVDVARVDGAEGDQPVAGHVFGFVGVCFDACFSLFRCGPGLHGGVCVDLCEDVVEFCGVGEVLGCEGVGEGED